MRAERSDIVVSLEKAKVCLIPWWEKDMWRGSSVEGGDGVVDWSSDGLDV